MEGLQFILALFLVYLGGKMVQQVNLPAILGWLVVGMLVGPHVLNILTTSLQNTSWYQFLTTLSQLIVGVMIGSSLRWEKIKQAGTQIFTLAASHALTIFIIVFFSFAAIFYFKSIPVILAFVLALIAIATAPAPALSVINEYQTDGPLSRAVVPMTVMNSVLANVVFFVSISILQSIYAQANLSILATLSYMFAIPIVLGGLAGYIVSLGIKKNTASRPALSLFLLGLLFFSLILIYINQSLFPAQLANFILSGASYAAVFVNCLNSKQADQVGEAFSIVQSAGLLILIMNLAAPLNPRLLLSAGLWSILYMLIRALGSCLGGYLGGRLINSDPAIQHYIGISMLPHSGVSLVLTGSAISALEVIAPQYIDFIAIIIPAAAIVNELIAIVLSKKVYEWAGEMDGKDSNDPNYMEEGSLYKQLPKEDHFYQNSRHHSLKKRWLDLKNK